MGLFRFQQMVLNEDIAVFRILEDRLRTPQADPIEDFRNRPQETGARARIDKEMTQPRDRINNAGNTQKTRRNGTINNRLDRKVMDNVWLNTLIQTDQMPDRPQLPKWFDALPGERKANPLEAICLHELVEFTRRGKQKNFMTLIAQFLGKRKTKVIDIPVGVGEEKDS